MKYTLMRKNEPICNLDISFSGDIVGLGKIVTNSDLLPLQHKDDKQGLIQWWNNRAVPIKQGKVKKMLKKNGYLSTKEYLVKNLGLSLTDYYWIKPVDSDLSWEKVNLYTNAFTNDFNGIFFHDSPTNAVNEYNPSSSLQGQLEKSWVIINDKRMLLKGNQDELSSESINEVIASKLHQLQGFHNYTPYKLAKIEGSQYDYGCVCESFTNLEKELVSAYDIVTSKKQPNDKSSYEHFISVCKDFGMDENQLRHDLEYQIMTDFLLSNTDRHLNNVAILRDADSLRFLQMAPIYDTGKSFFVGKQEVYTSQKELLNIKTISFASMELKLLSYVQDKNIVDINKLPSPEYIRHMYEKDSRINPERINQIVKCYEQKIDLFDKFQHGIDLSSYKFQVKQIPAQTMELKEDSFIQIIDDSCEDDK